jgi:protein CpxP
MKLIKTTFIAALAAGGLLACGPAFAQNTTPSGASPSTNAAPAMSRSGGYARMIQMLNLTEDQKTQVMPILNAQQQQMRAVFQDSSLSPNDKRAKIKTIRDQTNAQLQGILTSDQFAKWQKMQTRMRRMTPPPSTGTNAPATPPPPAPPTT